MFLVDRQFQTTIYMQPSNSAYAYRAPIRSAAWILPSGSSLSPQVQQLFEQLLGGGDNASVTSVLGRC